MRKTRSSPSGFVFSAEKRIRFAADGLQDIVAQSEAFSAANCAFAAGVAINIDPGNAFPTTINSALWRRAAPMPSGGKVVGLQVHQMAPGAGGALTYAVGRLSSNLSTLTELPVSILVQASSAAVHNLEVNDPAASFEPGDLLVLVCYHPALAGSPTDITAVVSVIEQ